MDRDKLAIGLGWFSVGLGLLEGLVPSAISTLTGTQQNTVVTQGLGVRELASGVGILAQEKERKRWLWSRVAGDAMDLALLGRALLAKQNDKTKVTMAMAAVAGVAVLDVIAASS